MKRLTALLLVLASAILPAGCRKDGAQQNPGSSQHSPEGIHDAGAYCYGRFKDYDFNMFCIYLLQGQTRIDDGVISGIGTALWIDMNASVNQDNIIPVGTYLPARNDYQNNAFIKGQRGRDENGNEIISGSYIYSRPLKGNAEYLMISNGAVKINVSGEKYSVEASVIAEGREYQFSYFGYFSYTDVNVNPGSSEGKEVEVKGLSHSLVTRLGACFDNDRLGDYCLWSVLLADDNYDLVHNEGSGDEVQFEIVTSGESDDIAGTYTVKTAEFNESTMERAVTPGSALCGYIEERVSGGQTYNDYYGCWYFAGNDESRWLGATAGEVRIGRSGDDTYTIEFDFTDQFAGNSRYFGKYSGKLEGDIAAGANPSRRSSPRTSRMMRRDEKISSRRAITSRKALSSR